ncbi:MAG: DUF2231 domain-containing protein [Anaeromyxobacteraceae bacterium]
MESKAKLAGHPIHPMLVAFPLGLFATSLVFDLIHLASGGERWGWTSFYMIGAGIVGALLAAVFGLVDWLAIPRGTRAWRVGAIHGLGNLAVVGLFIASWGLRYGDPGRAGGGAVVLSVVAVLLALVTGWLGGELVDRLGVGVDEGAHLDAPSSLSGRPAGERWTPERPIAPRRAT